MFGFLRLALTLLICILGVGWYLGWFSFTPAPADPSNGGKVNINVSVDRDKIRSDLTTAEQKISQRLHDSSKPATPSAPGLNIQIPNSTLGPITVQSPGQGSAPAEGPPQIQVQTQGFQFSAPIKYPAGEGR